MHAISVKTLREKMPFIRNELKKGTTFLIIHKSEPIAKLLPANWEMEDPNEESWEEATEEEIQQASLQDLEKNLGDDLTQKEIDYYLSLPDIK